MSDKKIVLVSNDLELHKRLDVTGLFQRVTMELDTSKIGNPDILVVSDKMLLYNDFIELYDSELYLIPYVFYMVSDNAVGNKQMIQALKLKGVICIPPKMTHQQITEKICCEAGINYSVQKNIVVFLGADSKVGTTITAQGVAETLAENTEGKVALLFLSGQPGTDYLPDDKDVYGMDSIKVKIVSKMLTASELRDIFIKKGNLSILPGVHLLMDVRYYSNENIENLIQLVSSLYDIVIIDAGCRVFNSMTVGSINSTQYRYLITTQQDSVRNCFERTCSQVFSELDISPKDFFLVVNKYVNLPEFYTASQIANMYGVPLLGTLPLLEYGWQAERDRTTLCCYDSGEYKKQIVELSKVVAGQVGIKFKNIQNKKEGFLKGLFGRRAE